MLTAERSKRQSGGLSQPKTKEPDPFVFSAQMVRALQLVDFARGVLRLATWRPMLRAGAGGRPDTYSDETVLVTVLVTLVWQLTPRQVCKYLARWPVLAAACGYPVGCTISASQLYRRRDRLGLWVFFMLFIALVWVLISRGVIAGRDWVIDSTLLDAFSRQDTEAGWSFSKRFGYKVHMLICRDSLLPLMLLVSPANRNDAPWAVPLMAWPTGSFGCPWKSCGPMPPTSPVSS